MRTFAFLAVSTALLQGCGAMIDTRFEDCEKGAPTFVSMADCQARTVRDDAARINNLAQRARSEARAQRLAEDERARAEAKESAVAGFWAALSPEERTRLEAEALATAQPSEHRLLRQGGLVARTVREKLLDAYALQCLQAGAV